MLYFARMCVKSRSSNPGTTHSKTIACHDSVDICLWWMKMWLRSKALLNVRNRHSESISDGGPNGLVNEFTTQSHSIHRLRCILLPHSSASAFFPCIIQEIHWDSLSKKGAGVKLVDANQCKESGLRLGVSDEKNESQEYRTREYTGPKKVRSTLRKSRITSQIETTALGRHSLCLRKACAGDTPGQSLPGLSLRPCSRFI